MKQIILAKGYVALIDDEDYELVSKYKWYFHNNGYARTSHGKTYMHRLIMNVNDKSIEIDHINHNKLDNRKENLRKCSHYENMKNKKMHKNNTSGVIGVSKDKNKWRSQIQVSGKTIFLGRFESIDEASIAYKKAEKQYSGDFSRK